MKKVFMFALAAALLALPAADALARKRTHVVIHKPPPHVSTQPVRAVPLVAVPPVAVAFDLIRRTSCDPAVAVSTGPGDPGFDPKGPLTGNFLIPAIYRSECQAQPRRARQ